MFNYMSISLWCDDVCIHIVINSPRVSWIGWCLYRYTYLRRFPVRLREVCIGELHMGKWAESLRALSFLSLSNKKSCEELMLCELRLWVSRHLLSLSLANRVPDLSSGLKDFFPNYSHSLRGGYLDKMYEDWIEVPGLWICMMVQI